MDPWERFGLEPEEYEKCLAAVEELRTLAPDAPAPSVDEIARDWARAKAAQLCSAVPALWRALGLAQAGGTLVRRLTPS